MRVVSDYQIKGLDEVVEEAIESHLNQMTVEELSFVCLARNVLSEKLLEKAYARIGEAEGLSSSVQRRLALVGLAKITELDAESELICDGKILADLIVDGKHVIEALVDEPSMIAKPKTGEVYQRQRGRLASELCESYGFASYRSVGWESYE